MESGTAAMEAITALVDGPLCFLVALAAVQNWGCRHPLQIVLCVMQIYGLVWFVLQPMYSDTGVAGHFSSDPVLFIFLLFAIIVVDCRLSYVFLLPFVISVVPVLGNRSWLQCSLGYCSTHTIGSIFVGSQRRSRQEGQEG